MRVAHHLCRRTMVVAVTRVTDGGVVGMREVYRRVIIVVTDEPRQRYGIVVAEAQHSREMDGCAAL